jgi:hypothetical protein
MKTSRRFALVVATSVVCALVPYPGQAQEPELKTTAVAAFKNGLAFVLKEENIHLDAGMGNLEPVQAIRTAWRELPTASFRNLQRIQPCTVLSERFGGRKHQRHDVRSCAESSVAAHRTGGVQTDALKLPTSIVKCLDNEKAT